MKYDITELISVSGVPEPLYQAVRILSDQYTEIANANKEAYSLLRGWVEADTVEDIMMLETQTRELLDGLDRRTNTETVR